MKHREFTLVMFLTVGSLLASTIGCASAPPPPPAAASAAPQADDDDDDDDGVPNAVDKCPGKKEDGKGDAKDGC